MKLLVSIPWAIVFVFAGIGLEKAGMREPSYFALFGLVMGSFQMILLDLVDLYHD